MSRYFAEIDANKTVLRVIVADSIEWCQKNLGGEWVETFIDKTDTHNYAGIGYLYSKEKKNFIAPRPFPSWTLNEKCRWIAPVEQPKNTLATWDEDKRVWAEPAPIGIVEEA